MFQNSSWLIIMGMLLLLFHITSIMSPIFFVWISSLYLSHTIPFLQPTACLPAFESLRIKLYFLFLLKSQLKPHSEVQHTENPKALVERSLYTDEVFHELPDQTTLRELDAASMELATSFDGYRKHLMTGLSVRLSVKSRLPTVLSRESLSYWWFLLPRGPRGFRDC